MGQWISRYDRYDRYNGSFGIPNSPNPPTLASYRPPPHAGGQHVPIHQASNPPHQPRAPLNRGIEAILYGAQLGMMLPLSFGVRYIDRACHSVMHGLQHLGLAVDAYRDRDWEGGVEHLEQTLWTVFQGMGYGIVALSHLFSWPLTTPLYMVVATIHRYQQCP